jgi:hypothetical protein
VWRIFCVGLALLVLALRAFFRMREKGGFDELARAIAVTHIPGLFKTELIPLWVWPWLCLGSLGYFLVLETEKLIIG